MNYKRKGFTLVELLIVIVVIGILSSMMMLSSTEAVSSAKATNIVAGLRNMKTAALAYYTDNMDFVDTGKKTVDGKDVTFKLEDKEDNDIQKAIRAYLNNGDGITGYTVVFGKSKIGGVENKDKAWFVKYTGIEVNAKAKLETKSKSLGLLKAAAFYDSGNDANGQYYVAGTGDTTDTVYMFIR